MKTELNELIEISRFYGTGKDYVIAGGGNTSFKDGQFIWIKASGFPLETLSMEGLVKLDRRKLEVISGKKYSDNPLEREEEVKNDLTLAVEKDFSDRRPSVETSLHNLIGYSFVVHLHPAVINGVLCSRKAEAIVRENFGDEALFIPYADPGYTLFKKLEKEISGYRDTKNRDPHIIFIENHGVFVGADTTPEIRKIYEEIIRIFSALCKPFPEEGDFGFNPLLAEVLPAIRMLLSRDSLKTLRWRNNALIDSFSKSQAQFQKISHALTPDIIVYCKHRYIYIDHSSSASRILESFRTQLERFTAEYGFLPRVIVIKDLGIIASGENYRSAEQILDVYEDLLKISWYASFCGGIKLLTPDQVDFIDKWEVENYRRKISLGKGKAGSNTNRIAVVTGAAQGFGAGIAGALLDQQMNIVVADINDEKGKAFAESLNEKNQAGHAVFIRTDVSQPEDVKNMVYAAVREFGGLDLMISNAAILKAGSLEEMDAGTFRKMTEINYNGFFYCAKYASEVMKLQHREKPDHFTDIIQINSKSGLKGSNKNFAYAGAKFGGIGLTQSFALELAPYRIKVNSICPGNFFDGPLWSDPSTGLFVQYLKAGKVPGARTIEDVKRYYEEQVPLGRGCRTEDLMKAILYVISQEYETGQAVPVTGGQVMLR